MRYIAYNLLLNHPNWSNSGSSLNGTSTVRRHIKNFYDYRVKNPSQSLIKSSFAFAIVSPKYPFIPSSIY